MNKQELIKVALDLFKRIDTMPQSFEPTKTPMGLDRDWAFQVLDETQVDENDKPIESSVYDIQSIAQTLSEYLELHEKEISELEFFQYTDPKSVSAIMNAIGSKGVLNTENGPCIFRDVDLKLNKTDYLVKQGEKLFVINELEYKKYLNF